jgi:hypothetical protein
MELNLHPIATKCFVSGRDFQEHDRVVSYLVRESTGEVARRDLLESEDTGQAPSALSPTPQVSPLSPPASVLPPPAFTYCRWISSFKQRRADENADRNLKLTAENLFLTLAIPAGSDDYAPSVEGLPSNVERPPSTPDPRPSTSPGSINTPLLQFLALMLERKKQIKPRGLTEDGQRQLYEHMATHQLYEVPVGDLNVEFFQKIQEHLGVLVGTPKPKAESVLVTG